MVDRFLAPGYKLHESASDNFTCIMMRVQVKVYKLNDSASKSIVCRPCMLMIAIATFKIVAYQICALLIILNFIQLSDNRQIL